MRLSMTTQRRHSMKTVTLKDEFTNSERTLLDDIIFEKLAEMGHEGVVAFSFDVTVDFEQEDTA